MGGGGWRFRGMLPALNICTSGVSMHDELEQFLLARSLADCLDAHIHEPSVLEHRDIDALDREHRVVELAVADDVAAIGAGGKDLPEARHVGLDILKILMDVLAEKGVSSADVIDDAIELREGDLSVTIGGPGVEQACSAAPRAADGFPVEFAGCAAVGKVAEPVHVGAKFADVGHPVGIGRRGDDAGVAALPRGENGGEITRISEKYTAIGGGRLDAQAVGDFIGRDHEGVGEAVGRLRWSRSRASRHCRSS